MKLLPVVCLLSILVLGADAVCKASLTDFEQAALDKHNEFRRLHSDTDDLCYGETGTDISFYSQTWADEMADAKSMTHSTSSDYYDSSNPYGENLAYAGTSGTPREEDAAYEYSTESWYNDEISNWDFSTSTGTGTYGHFTQVVWKNSQQVNCGYATFTSNSGFNSYYVVCQYYPAGNSGWQSDYAANVASLVADDNDTDDDSDSDDGSNDTDDGSNDTDDGSSDDSDDESCEDKSAWGCGYWEEQGYCDSTSLYYIYMTDNCAASCGLC